MVKQTETSLDRTEDVPQDGQHEAGESGHRALEIVTPLFLLAVALWVIVSSLDLGYWTPIGPGPGFSPLWLAGLLGAMSITWLVQNLRNKPGVAAEPGTVDTDESLPIEEPAQEPLNLKQVLAVLASLIAVTTLLTVLGFQLSMLLFLLFHLKVLARRRWVLSVSLSVLGSFGVFTVFTQFLTVSLPTSSIPLLRSMGL